MCLRVVWQGHRGPPEGRAARAARAVRLCHHLLQRHRGLHHAVQLLHTHTGRAATAGRWPARWKGRLSGWMGEWVCVWFEVM